MSRLTSHIDTELFIASPTDLIAGTVIHVDGGAVAQVTIPWGNFVQDANYQQVGDDLVLTGEDEIGVVVKDFFASPDHPDLISDSGLLIDGDLAARLAGAAPLTLHAQAGGGGTAAPIGQVQTAEGVVTVTRVDGSTGQLSAGAPVFQGDIVETGPGGAVGLVFNDQSSFALGESGRMVLDEFVYDPATGDGNSTTSVVKGVFTFISGSVADSQADAMVVKTPVFTVGIRGTEGAGRGAADGVTNAISLLKGGPLAVCTAKGCVFLDTLGDTAANNSSQEVPTLFENLTSEQIISIFGQEVLALYSNHMAQNAQHGGQQGLFDNVDPNGLPDNIPFKIVPPEGQQEGSLGTKLFLGVLNPEGLTPIQAIIIPADIQVVVDTYREYIDLLEGDGIGGGGVNNILNVQLARLTPTYGMTFPVPGELTPLVDGAWIENWMDIGLPPSPLQVVFLTATSTTVVFTAGTVVPVAPVGPYTIMGGFVNTGVMVFDRDTIILNDGLTTTNAGTFQFVGNPTVIVQGGALTTTGSFTGTGIIDVTTSVLYIDGILSPGASPGVLTFIGDAIFGPNAVMIMELGDPANPSTTDKITFTGSIDANGVVQVEIPSWFAGQNGDSYDLVFYGGLVGGVFDMTLVTNIANMTFENLFGLTITGVTVFAGNVPPEVGALSIGAPADGTATGNLLSVATDLNNDPLTVSGVTGGWLSMLQVDPTGQAIFTPDNTNPTIQALAAGETASTTVNFTVDDGQGGTGIGTLTLTVTGINDLPTAVADTANVFNDPLQFSVSGNLLANDTDPDASDVLTIQGGPGNAMGTYGMLSWAADGSYTYSLNMADPLVANLTTLQGLSDSFSYTVADGNGGTATANLTVNISGLIDNQFPVAVNDGVLTDEDSTVPASGNLLSNDSDPDLGDVLTVSAVTGGDAYGTLTWLPDGTFDYLVNPLNGAFITLAPGQTLTDVYTYTVSDLFGFTSTAILTVTIDGLNDAPIASADLISISEDTLTATGNLLGNDFDGDGDTLTLQSVGGGNVYGQLSFSAITGDVTYTINDQDPLVYAQVQGLNGGQMLSDTYTYTIVDSAGNFSQGSLTIMILGVTDPGNYWEDLLVTDFYSGVIGDDTLLGLSGDDYLYGNTGDDSIDGGSGWNWLSGGYGNDTLIGGTWYDVATYFDSPAGIVVNYTMDGAGTASDGWGTTDTFSSIDDIEGSSFGDSITAGGEVWMGEGWDGPQIYGYGGNDTITYNGLGWTYLGGGSGNDILQALNSTGANLFGGSHNDTLIGGVGWDYIVGDSADDVIQGDDSLSGGGGWDIMWGGDGADTLDGGTGDDDLYGEGGDDLLLGGAGDDFISGGTGADILSGGAGQDTFYIVEDTLAGTNDIITDFNNVDDAIQVSGTAYGATVFGGLTDGIEFSTIAGSYDGTNGTSTRALANSDSWVYSQADSALYFDPDGNAGGATYSLVVDFATDVGLQAGNVTVV